MRKILILLLLIVFTSRARPQGQGYVQVTGTKSCYQNGSVQGAFVNQSTTPQLPLLNGSVFPTTGVTNMNSSGTFSIFLADNNQVFPTPSQWSLTVCAQSGGQPSCGTTQLTITAQPGGGPQDISSTIASFPCPSGSNGQPAGGPYSTQVKNIDGSLYGTPITIPADMMPDATPDGKIADAYSKLPAAGGIIDVRGIQGNQNFASNLVLGTVAGSKPATFIFGAISINCPGNGLACVQTGSNVQIIGCGKGCTNFTNPNNSLEFSRFIGPLQGAHDIKIQNVDFHGNYFNQTASFEHQDCIFLNDNWNVEIFGNDFDQCRGSGIQTFGSITPQNFTISSISGTGTTGTIVFSAPFPTWTAGQPFCIIYTWTDWDSARARTCYTVSGGSAGTYTFAATQTDTIGALGLAAPQNFTNELIGTGNGTQTQFIYTLQNQNIVPATVTITTGGNVFQSDFWGKISGPTPTTGLNGNAQVDYASGQIYINFQTAPASGAPVTVNYAAGGSGYSAKINVHDNTSTTFNLRGFISFIAGRDIKVTHNFISNAIPFGDFHGEPNNSELPVESIEIGNNTILGYGSAISATAQINAGLSCSHWNIHDNILIGASLLVNRCPYSAIRNNQFINTASASPILCTTVGCDIEGNSITNTTSPTTPSTGSAGIDVDNTQANNQSGFPIGQGGSRIIGNHLKGINVRGISVAGSNDTIVSQNTIENIFNPLNNINFSECINVSGNGTTTGLNNVITDNSCADTQTTPTTQTGFDIESTTNAYVAGNVARNVVTRNYVDVGNVGTVWGLSPSLAGVTGSIGGTSLAPGACTDATVTILNWPASKHPNVTPVSFPGAGFIWFGHRSAANTIDVAVCNISAAAQTPNGSLYTVN
jgi:hypothetical protein